MSIKVDMTGTEYDIGLIAARKERDEHLDDWIEGWIQWDVFTEEEIQGLLKDCRSPFTLTSKQFVAARRLDVKEGYKSSSPIESLKRHKHKEIWDEIKLLLREEVQPCSAGST